MTGMICVLMYFIGSDGTTSDTQTLESIRGTYQVRYVTDPKVIVLNEPFAIDIWVHRSDGNKLHASFELVVDARMPQHRHGMNRIPKKTRLTDGHYRVEGMLFHMPGSWEIYFDLSRAGRSERARAVVVLD